jgi:hypothetical protein
LIQRAVGRRARRDGLESLSGTPVDRFTDRLLELGAGSTPPALYSSAFYGPLSTFGGHKRVWRIGRLSGWINTVEPPAGAGFAGRSFPLPALRVNDRIKAFAPAGALGPGQGLGLSG